MEKLAKFIKKNYWLIFIGAIILYIVIVFLFLIQKYNSFGYNGMDLAIFNQVFHNSAHGNLFYFTIHPHSYLGDHFTPFLILLLPIYSLFKSPLTLLFLQTLIIGLCTIPIYLLAKYNLNKAWALILPILWLLNPIVININFFEFHLLPFAIFFLLFTIYFYQKKNFSLFILFSLLSLSVREDVFLVIFMFGILALIQKRKANPHTFGKVVGIKWILSPLILSIAWFAVSQSIIIPNNPMGGYKFIPYYNWLGGNSILEIAKNYLIHPLSVIVHLLSLNNIVMVLGLLMPFAFLPLLKPQCLILALGIFLQFALTKKGGGDTVLKTHYASLFLPAMIMSFIYSLKSIYNVQKLKTLKTLKFFRKNKSLILIIIIISSLYSFITLSPIEIYNKNKAKINKLDIKIKKELLKYIPNNEAVATSYEFLPNLSNRPKLYSLHYAWQGYKQLSNLPYELPKDTEYILVNFDDKLTYNIQYIQGDENKIHENSYLNWQKIFQEYNLSPIKIIDTYGIWKYDFEIENEIKKEKSDFLLYKIINIKDGKSYQAELEKIQNKQNTVINNQITFLGWDKINKSELNKLERTSLQLIPISLSFKKNNNVNITDNYQLQLKLIPEQSDKNEYTKIYPLTYGFYPTSKWENNEIIKINYWFLIPSEFYTNKFNIKINLVNAKGLYTLDKNRSLIRSYPKIDILKPDIKIEF